MSDDVDVWASAEPGQRPGPLGGMVLVGTLRTGPPAPPYFDGSTGRLVLDCEQLDQVTPLPVDAEAVLAAWRELGVAVNTAYEQIGRALAPWLVNLRAMLDDLAERHPGLLDDPGPVDVAERALWVKQRPGRTGPPTPRRDGRRRR